MWPVTIATIAPMNGQMMKFAIPKMSETIARLLVFGGPYAGCPGAHVGAGAAYW